MKNHFNPLNSRDGAEYEEIVINHEKSLNEARLIKRNFPIFGTGIEIDAVIEIPLRDKKGGMFSKASQNTFKPKVVRVEEVKSQEPEGQIV